MSIRIAILGNSQTAALKSAWDANQASYPDVRFVFFAARSSPNTRFPKLQPVGGKLVARQPKMAESFRLTSGGLTEIDGSAYDAFALIGMAPRLIVLPPASAYSAAVRDAMYEAGRKRRFAKTLAKIQAIAPDKPVFVPAMPLSADPPDDVGPTTELYQRSIDVMEREVFARLGVVYLPQLADTVVGNCWTSPEYAVNPPGPRTATGGLSDDDQTKEDVRHMNAAYGALVLEQLVQAVRDRLV